MSNTIPSGDYMIVNVGYPNRYVCMSENKDFAGHDVGQTIKVDIKDENQCLATFYDTATELYLGVDQTDAKVKGYTDPQVFQLYNARDGSFEIRVPNGDKMWVLEDGGDWTPITVQATAGSDGEYWRFVMGTPE